MFNYGTSNYIVYKDYSNSSDSNFENSSSAKPGTLSGIMKNATIIVNAQLQPNEEIVDNEVTGYQK